MKHREWRRLFGAQGHTALKIHATTPSNPPHQQTHVRVRTNAAVVSASFFQSLRPLGRPDLSKEGCVIHSVGLSAFRIAWLPFGQPHRGRLSRNSIASLGASFLALTLKGLEYPFTGIPIRWWATPQARMHVGSGTLLGRINGPGESDHAKERGSRGNGFLANTRVPPEMYYDSQYLWQAFSHDQYTGLAIYSAVGGLRSAERWLFVTPQHRLVYTFGRICRPSAVRRGLAAIRQD